MRSIAAPLLLVLCVRTSPGQEPQPQVWDFEVAKSGALPPGWTVAKTGEGEGSVWKVMEDKSAPSGARVLAQVAAGPTALFNLCVADWAAQDLELSVALKAVKGEVDQGGGVLWRYADASNYYIARFNPLEENYRLYKVVDGKRMQLATRESLPAPAGQWHTLTIRMKGDAIECSLNGKKLLDAKDGTFTKAGKIGLWTKADAQMYFDKIEAKSLR